MEMSMRDDIEKKMAAAGAEAPVYLHTVLERRMGDAETKAIMRRYSAYKYGSAREIAAFAAEFVSAIQKHVSSSHMSQCVVVTPPFRFSGLPSSVVPVAEKVAGALGIEYVKGYTEGDDELAVGRYTGIGNLEARLADRKKTKTRFLTADGGLHGKHVILIDDIFVTGSTLINLCHNLRQEGVTSISPFVIAYLESQSPTFEEVVNTDILADVPAFLRELNHPDLIVNRRTFKTVYLLPDADFSMVVDGLAVPSLDKLIAAGDLYVRGRQDPARLEYMESVASLRRQDIQLLTADQQRLTHVDLQTLSRLRKFVREQLHGQMILSGGYATEVLAGGSITRFHQDMDVRIFLPEGNTAEETMAKLLPVLSSAGYEGWHCIKQVAAKFKMLGKDKQGTERQLEVNFESASGTSPDGTIYVAGDKDGSDYAVSIATGTLLDNDGESIAIETRSMAETVARRIMRLSGKYMQAKRAAKPSDVRDLQRLMSSAEYDERTCAAFIANYVRTVHRLKLSDTQKAAQEEIASARQSIHDYTVEHIA
jgi:predicted amidophosphoribosyltransferase